MRVLFAAVAPLVLAACFTETDTPPAAEKIGGEPIPGSEIRIYRPMIAGEAEVTSFLAPLITVNGQTVGDCISGQPLSIRVPRGNWSVTAMTANDEVTRDVGLSDGEAAYFRCDTGDTNAPTAPTLVRVTAAIAAAEGGL